MLTSMLGPRDTEDVGNVLQWSSAGFRIILWFFKMFRSSSTAFSINLGGLKLEEIPQKEPKTILSAY